MKKNMGMADRIFRIVVAVVLGALYFTGTVGGAPGIVLLILAVIFLVTGLIGRCGIYSLMGLDSCVKEKE